MTWARQGKPCPTPALRVGQGSPCAAMTTPRPAAAPNQVEDGRVPYPCAPVGQGLPCRGHDRPHAPPRHRTRRKMVAAGQALPYPCAPVGQGLPCRGHDRHHAPPRHQTRWKMGAAGQALPYKLRMSEPQLPPPPAEPLDSRRVLLLPHGPPARDRNSTSRCSAQPGPPYHWYFKSPRLIMRFSRRTRGRLVVPVRRAAPRRVDRGAHQRQQRTALQPRPVHRLFVRGQRHPRRAAQRREQIQQRPFCVTRRPAQAHASRSARGGRINSGTRTDPS